ncbi:MAG TPA: hypothetical protein QGF35_00460 [Dehalococcoidia bacterium]|nr:hypothetical protein [Dehalococcoidia bacterium]
MIAPRGLVAVLAIGLLAAACSSSDEEELPDGWAFNGLLQPRAIHLTQDGRIVVAEAGTGLNDGRVSVVDPDGNGREVVIEGLPSVSGAGEPWGDVAGAAGAAMAPDGTVCVVIGIPEPLPEAIGELRCTDGLTVDLKAWEEANDPDEFGPASRLFDIVAEGDAGWWVSDAAGNTVLHIDRAGEVVLGGLFPSFGTFDPPMEGRTTGLTVAGTSPIGAASRGPRGGIPQRGGLVVALFNGALAVVRPIDPDDPGLGFANTPNAIAAFANEQFLYFLVHSGSGAGIYDTARTPLWMGTGGTGFVQLPDGAFIVAVAGEGRLIRVE